MADTLLDTYASEAIRGMDSFTRCMKTTDADRIRVAVAKHLFTQYPVPKHVEAVWIERPVEGNAGHLRRRPTTPTERRRFPDEMRKCYFHVGAGRSIHRELFKDWLSKKETHRFLTCPFGLSYDETMVWTIARTFADDNGLALRIARSKVCKSGNYHSDFWRDVTRFFTANPLPINEINDLVDYIAAARARDNAFSLKGRSLDAVRARMKEWHKELALVKRIGHERWDGLAVEDWSFEDKNNHKTWVVKQILNGKTLAEEGTAMHHCVYTYLHACNNGGVGIFSMEFRTQHRQARSLTIEVTDHGQVVQVRGFGNRLHTNEEDIVLKKWSADRALRITPNRY